MVRLLTLYFIFVSIGLKSQVVDLKYPAGWGKKIETSIPTFTFPKIDHRKLIVQDSLKALNKEEPYRFAIAFNTNIDVIKTGKKQRDKMGNNHWLLKLDVSDAYGVGLIFSEFNIPDGGELYIYNKEKTALLGAINSKNNNTNHVLSVMPIKGSEIIVHYTESQNAEFNGHLILKTVTHVYRNIFNLDKGFGDSGSCNINVVCTEGSKWEKQIRSVAMIVTNNGTRWCTGTLINNTQNDNIPYFLTANHCLLDTGDDPATWSIIFNYKSPECSPSENGLLGNSVFGAEVKASNTTNDFALLQLNQTPPDAYNVYYSGWSRNVVGIENSTGIHHPNGDVMKISEDFDAPELSAYLGGSGDDYWRVVDWDKGTTEGGSSGSALYNNEGQIIGQLRGGQAACNNELSDYYGALYKSWEGTNSSNRLKDWLDPENLNPDTLNGNDPLIDGVADLNKNDGIFVYPNPARDRVFIRDNKQVLLKSISLIDVQGRVVRKEMVDDLRESNRVEFSLQEIKPGLYIILAQTEGKSVFYKLIVE